MQPAWQPPLAEQMRHPQSRKKGFRLSDRGRRVRRVRLEGAGPVRVFVRLRPPAGEAPKGQIWVFQVP